MIGTLLKKQLMEIFRSYFYNSKKNCRRSAASTALLFVMFGVLMIGICGGIFAFLSVAICLPLAVAGVGWFYFLIMSAMAIALGTFGSVFNTFSGLYLAKDNDLLLSMPISPSVIVFSRLLGVYLMGLMYSAIVLLPAVVVYWILVSASVSAIVGGILLLAQVSLIVMILSCLLGWAVAKISCKLKNKSFITVLFSLLGFGLYYFCYFKAQQVVADLVANAAEVGKSVREKIYPLYLLGSVGTGDWLSMLLVTVVVAVLFAVMWAILSRSFIGIALSAASTSVGKGGRKDFQSRSLSATLLHKEFCRFTSSATYMLNCGFGLLILPVVGVFLALKGRVLSQALLGAFAISNEQMTGWIAVGLFSLLGLCITLNDPAAPSVSLEGKNLWILRSLPILPWQILKAKLQMQLILTSVPTLIAGICAATILQSVPMGLLLIVDLLLFCLFHALFSLCIGVKMPNFHWTSEITPIKQSGSVFFALIGGAAIAVLLGVLYIPLARGVNPMGYFGILFLLLALLSFFLLRWLKKRGTALLETYT